MEKESRIKEDDFSKGFYIELECFICMEQATFAAKTIDDLQELVNDSGWLNLDSDKFGTNGHYCGCHYKS